MNQESTFVGNAVTLRLPYHFFVRRFWDQPYGKEEPGYFAFDVQPLNEQASLLFEDRFYRLPSVDAKTPRALVEWARDAEIRDHRAPTAIVSKAIGKLTYITYDYPAPTDKKWMFSRGVLVFPSGKVVRMMGRRMVGDNKYVGELESVMAMTTESVK